MRFHSASFLSTLLSTFCAYILLLPVFHLHLKVVSQTFRDVSFSWSIMRIRDCVFLHSPSSFSSPTTISRSSSYHHGEFFICQSVPRRVSFLSSHLTSEQPHLAGGQKPLTERKTRSTSPRPHIKRWTQVCLQGRKDVALSLQGPPAVPSNQDCLGRWEEPY